MGCVNGKANHDAKSSGAVVEDALKGPQKQRPQTAVIEGKKVEAAFEKKAVELGVFGEKTGQSRSGDSRSLYSTFESEIGLPRLSRLSSQYLPPSGFRLIQVPAWNYELRYSYLSQRGYYPEALDKANQDSFCVHTQFGKDPNDHFFGVFDGHGEFGTQCSQFAKRNLCENLLRNAHYKTDAVQAYHASYAATNTQLHRSTIDDSMSGTTSITVLVRGNTLYVANVGDSRAVLAERRGGRLVAVDLSSDQTPYRADECDRVKLCGARVLTLDQLEGLKNPNVKCWGGEDDDDGDPPRLWVANGMYPGTAFTRSIGDTVAERIGVIAVPEVLVMELNDKHTFFVIASDGVFEFLSSQAVVDMVSKFKDPRDACAAVVTESYRLWLQYETRTDDITIIVVFIDGLEDAGGNTALEEDASLASNILYEMEENESPLTSKRIFTETRPPRHDPSAARLRAIEASLEQEALWAPPSELRTKTPEEKAHIKHALQGNFLFHKLMEKQWQVLYDCLKRVYVHAGEIVIRQGAEDEHFYIVESGEFEVLVSEQQGGNPGDEDLGTVVHRHTRNSSTCFGDLALMYNKPRQASIRAVTDGTLWTLDREAFRGLLLMKYTHRSALKYLRTVEMFSRLSLGQLVHLADCLTELQYQDGDIIVKKDDELDSFYIIHQGSVQLTYHNGPKESSPVSLSNGSTLTEENCNDVSCSFYSDAEKPGASSDEQDRSERKGEGSYFGEWVLLCGPKEFVTAVAVGDVECWKISRDTFESAVGPLGQILESDLKMREKMSSLRNKQMPEVAETSFETTQLSHLEWRKTLYVTDCSEVGLVRLKDSEQIVSMKRYSRQKVMQLNREAKVLVEKSIIEGLTPSIYVPQVLRTCIDNNYAALLLNTYLSGTLASILTAPLDEISARYLSASIVLALEFLHKDGVVYRGVSPDIILLDRKARLQLVDFRFAKKLSDERTFTICGMADFLAPEVVRGQGHGLAADWWALGVLTFYMLQNELPFGTWRDNELDVFARIARRQLLFPPHFSLDVVDFIDKLLLVDPSERLGCGNSGVDAIKQHPWFADLDWEGLLECRVEVPLEITSRLESALAFPHTEDHQHETSRTDTQHNEASLWLENW
ncbi:hypothetical protein O6H91_07G056700 [Diphasiastrum complanatum]|uniref:Uncharacterized protein n=6 Tax=Diphasiastrum complanatum TaxID=34168 RepID=A0ACC2D6D8_DIPCM|nr:hypothetical protein O6H91_07G056700 [Diphasiastrum complanatum]KAJ7549508.1 hypothetical protein O6H91_07G056700 [Diphasiastrum complanatum]KAJ7549509.1 hypothetical protein O6H91_07G056700 [Diphasiastrum complanatum]KAJ7549510.1 hypothetical protein O6H91_07G056700 [Diphasiastrum complanatum]KAJ7549511.1 hypothetical protein O6H91_07G056700 [Diphasiastrum complanatum]